MPDYRNIERAARRERPARVPLYEHLISTAVMEEILDRKFADLAGGEREDRREFLRMYSRFFLEMGYDTVSYECCIGPVMPGSGALGGNKPGVIRDREDFERYPWAEIPSRFFATYGSNFELLGEVMPPGMKAVGGPGNGVFECVQDVVGYEQLCYISADDPELYAALFRRVGDIMGEIWGIFLERFADAYTVCRFGDDLGYKTSTLISAEDIRELIIPQYSRVIERIHAAGRPFLLHSCGNIVEVMEGLIATAGIDAKHSNEDQIAPFVWWLEEYGSRIALFGGLDTDILCRGGEEEIRKAVQETMDAASGYPGFAFGSGNSIPDYVPVEGYLAMVRAAREFRGDGS